MVLLIMIRVNGNQKSEWTVQSDLAPCSSVRSDLLTAFPGKNAAIISHAHEIGCNQALAPRAQCLLD